MADYHENPDQEMRAQMRKLGLALGEAVQPHGYVLLVFEMNSPINSPSGHMNYISNAVREDVIVALKELLARFEGQPYIEGRA